MRESVRYDAVDEERGSNMDVVYDKAAHVALLRPDAPLTAADFTQAAAELDPIIEHAGPLTGLVVCAPTFPGWDSLSGLIAHVRFVHDHHARIERVALVMDALLGDVASAVATHFVAADIRHFHYAQLDDALEWVKS